VARKWLLEKHGTRFVGWMSALGEIDIPFEECRAHPEQPVLRPQRRRSSRSSRRTWTLLRKAGDSCGARIEVRASGVPVGLGEPLYDKLDADIAYAMMGINAVKGVEIGAGFASVAQRGSAHGDELTPEGFASQQRRRRARRHLHRAGPGGVDRDQADQLHPHAACVDRPCRPADHGGDLRSPRPLRRHPRDADRRGACWRWW
jgi:hypothetical protein